MPTTPMIAAPSAEMASPAAPVLVARTVPPRMRSVPSAFRQSAAATSSTLSALVNVAELPPLVNRSSVPPLIVTSPSAESPLPAWPEWVTTIVPASTVRLPSHLMAAQ